MRDPREFPLLNKEVLLVREALDPNDPDLGILLPPAYDRLVRDFGRPSSNGNIGRNGCITHDYTYKPGRGELRVDADKRPISGI